VNISKQILAAVAVALTALAVTVPARAMPFDSILFFGDSLSDTGNVWYATGGFPAAPYNQGSAGGPPDFTGGQWSDPLGPSWPTVFAAMFGLDATPSLAGGNNYAWGGARTGVNPDPAGVPWLDQQVGLYASTGTPPTDRTLASVMIGGNDVASNLGNGAAITAGIESITTQLGILYDLGIRELLVANVPDIGATPLFRELDAAAPGTAALATASTLQWNSALSSALDGLDLPGANVNLLDLYGLASDPELLAGFTNTTDACLSNGSVCPNPAEYFYWDPFHPSSTAHALIADAAFTATVPEPGPLTLLCLGLAMLVLGSQRRQA
jgi:phospholipase/lecithinase/hemolysin